jgi:riboflavin biosynthesis pyrimidine reductase
MGIGFPHAEKDVYVITCTARATKGKILRGLVTRQKGHIFLDGGAEIADVSLKEQLIEKFID